MKKGTIVLIVVGVILLFSVVSFVSMYNGFVAKSENVNNKLSQIDNQLQRRNDLIPNLVESVKGYAKQEKDIFTNVADARAKLAGASTVADKANADAQVTGALSRLLAIAENYPQLKSDANFRQLSDELAGTENRIAAARKDYNDAAQAFNTSIKKFPAVFFANIFGFKQFEYFQAAQGAKSVPKVDFGG